MFRKLAAAAVTATLMVAGAAHAEMPKEINFGIISTESSAGLKESFQPFLDDMSKALGVPVKPFFASDYSGIIEGMRFDKVDVAWFGNKSAMTAVDRAGGEIFAQTVDAGGNPGYWSLLITHKDSGLTLADVLKCDGTVDFGIGDPQSTSGTLVPTFYIFAKNGIDPKTCFKTMRSTNHEGNALAVANKQVDVATNNTESLYGRLVKNNPEAAANIKEIWRSPLIPSDPMVWRANLDEDVKAKIYYFFMNYGRTGDIARQQHERDVLAGMSSGWGPFLASSNAQLIPIRQMSLFKDKLNIESDDAMSEADKKAKLAEIDDQLAELDKWAEVVAVRTETN
jgi:phosphonate transport system substrate-binding protein